VCSNRGERAGRPQQQSRVRLAFKHFGTGSRSSHLISTQSVFLSPFIPTDIHLFIFFLFFIFFLPEFIYFSYGIASIAGADENLLKKKKKPHRVKRPGSPPPPPYLPNLSKFKRNYEISNFSFGFNQKEITSGMDSYLFGYILIQCSSYFSLSLTCSSLFSEIIFPEVG
jgi:hypothetical protein